MKSALLTFLLLFAFHSIATAQNVVVYQSDFSQGVNGGTIAPGVTINWSTSNPRPGLTSPVQTVTAPLDGRVFLGQFGVQDVMLSLQGFPAHDSITLTFDFYAINTWDGNYTGRNPSDTSDDSVRDQPDIFGLDADGTDTLLYATFCNNINFGQTQSYPDTAKYLLNGPNNENPAESGALSTGQLNFPNPLGHKIGIFGAEDAEYHMTYTFANSDSFVQLIFIGKMVDGKFDSLSDENWGIDSVVVRAICTPPLAVIVLNNPRQLCEGDSVTLIASPVGLNYKWLKNSQTLPVASNSITVSDSGIYSLIVSNACGSSDSTAITVTVNPVPVAAITGSNTICAGNSTVLKASPAGLSYQWEKNGRLQTVISDSLLVTDTGEYTLIASNSSGCSDSTYVTVSVASAPVAAITGIRSFCAGSSTILRASPSGFNYKWLKNSQDLPVTSDSITVSDSGIYSVIVSNASGCSDSTSISISNASPVASITASDTITSEGTSLSASNGVAYLWSNGDTTQTISVSKAGSYFVAVTDTNGCISTSSVFDFVPICGEESLEEALRGSIITIDGIIPNPSSFSTTLCYSLPTESSVSITIYDALGRIVALPVGSEMEVGGRHEASFDTKDFPPGLYTCCLNIGDAVMTTKMVVVR
jgi:hypothetical protein